MQAIGIRSGEHPNGMERWSDLVGNNKLRKSGLGLANLAEHSEW